MDRGTVFLRCERKPCKLERGRNKMSYTCTHTHTKRQFHSSRGKREGKKERDRET
jgi:hypothetical protein